MMRSLIITLFCCLSFYACKEQEGTHISREKMVGIMGDLHLAEVYSTMVSDSLHRATNKNYDSLALYYKSILAHHKVSMEDFKSSLHWYSAHTEEMDSVYVKVLTDISVLEGMLGISPQ